MKPFPTGRTQFCQEWKILCAGFFPGGGTSGSFGAGASYHKDNSRDGVGFVSKTQLHNKEDPKIRHAIDQLNFIIISLMTQARRSSGRLPSKAPLMGSVLHNAPSVPQAPFPAPRKGQ